MNREDIIRMAREAGIDAESDTLCRYNGWVEPLERFAALVAAAAIKSTSGYERGFSDGSILEREACAKIVDGNADACEGLMEQVLRSNAAAIRARGQA